MQRMVFWDFHGTLTPPDHGWSPTVLELARTVRPELTWEDVSAVMADEGFPWRRWREEQAWQRQPGAWWRHVERHVYGETLRRLGLSEADCQRLAALGREKELQPSRYRLYPGVPDMLEALRRRGWRHALLSNNFPELADIVEALGIRPAFEAILVSANLGYDKPHPEFFRQALAACGHPEVAVMVGDNPRRDIAGAHAAGLRTIWIARGRAYEGTVEPDYVCDLPTDVPACLEAIPC